MPSFSLRLQPLYGGGYAVAFSQAATMYYITAVLLHYIIPFFLPVTSIQKGKRSQGQILREAFTSLGPIAIKAAAWTCVEKLHATGRGLLYAGPLCTSVTSTAYAIATVIALDYLHDTWFYWTHRLLHWRPLYKHVHAIHHRSTVPTAFTGYSFHVLEAIIVFANEILVCFLFPIHIGLHRVYHIFTTAIHNGGHAGYEIAPFIPSIEALILAAFCGNKRKDFARVLNTVQHHDLHHRYPSFHFSLYMTHWDRMCGTEHPSYSSPVNDQHCHHRS